MPSSPLVLVGPAVLGPGTYQVNDFGDAGCEKSLRKKEKKGDITTDVQRTTGEGENHKSLRVSIWVELGVRTEWDNGEGEGINNQCLKILHSV